jgi:hypothetical protein
MNPVAISAIAALGGSSLGTMGTVMSNYVLQRSVTRRDLMNHVFASRQTLYSDFISEAARLYADAMTQSNYSLNELVTLYSLVGRIRLTASEPVMNAAEDVVKLIVSHYGQANLTLEDLRTAALSSETDPFHLFSNACRKDLYSLSHWSG